MTFADDGDSPRALGAGVLAFLDGDEISAVVGLVWVCSVALVAVPTALLLVS